MIAGGESSVSRCATSRLRPTTAIGVRNSKPSPATACAIQQERVVLAYQYLWEMQPFYRAKFERAGLAADSVRSLSDLAKIPVTRREEWLENQGSESPLGHVLAAGQGIGPSGGGCFSPPRGQRPPSRAGFATRRTIATCGSRRAPGGYLCHGYPPRDIAINCFGYGTSVAFWGLHYALNLMGVPVISGGGANTERRAFFIQTYRPTMLLCTPSYVLYLGA